MFPRRGDSRIIRENIRNDNGRFVNRPYKRISAEILFSLPICVIMGLYRRAGACSRRNERLESKKAVGVNPHPTKGMGFARHVCKTNAKLV